MASPQRETPEYEDRIELGYHPMKDALVGSTHAENVKHVLARLAFMSVMFEDKRVNELWWDWGKYTGLNEAAGKMASAWDQVADAAGVDHRGYVWELLETESDDNVSALENCLGCELVEAANAALDEFVQCMEKLRNHADRLTDEATVFVRDTLQLRWPWLALELIECFGYAVLGFALGRVQRFEGWAEGIEPVAPDVEIEYKTVPGESLSQAIERLTESFIEAIEKITKPQDHESLPRGRIPLDEEVELQDGVGKYARWFYRNRICGESIRHIAVTDEYDRATVRRGINEAERLLGLTQWVF